MAQQLTAFLVPPVSLVINAIRRKYDPVMAARIDPHFTVLYEVDDIERTTSQIRRTPGSRRPLHLVLTSVCRWSPPSDDGIYASLTDVDGDLGRFRRAASHEPLNPSYEPHITLMHPLTTEPAARDSAWDELGGLVFDQPIAVHQVTFIRPGELGQWSEAGRIDLAEE